jgi:hypothetical protein
MALLWVGFGFGCWARGFMALRAGFYGAARGWGVLVAKPLSNF